MTFWQDLAAIRGFAGEDIEAAKYHPEDRASWSTNRRSFTTRWSGTP